MTSYIYEFYDPKIVGKVESCRSLYNPSGCDSSSTMWRISRRAASNLQDFCPAHGIGPGKRGFSSTIFVSRLSSYTTEKGFQERFSKFGTIKEVRLVKDERTNRPKGFGFVEFRTEAEALKAIKAMNHKIVDGRLIFVEFAKSCSPREVHSESHQNPPDSTQY